MAKTEDLPDFQDIISQLDLEKVCEAILLSTEKLDEWDFRDAKELVWAAGEKWLARDLSEFTLEGVEKEVFLVSEDYFHGFVDLTGTLKGKKKPFDAFAGKKYVLDWKTTKGNLDTTWRQRLINSWQWMEYSEATKASIFVYRGLSRKDNSLAEIIIKVPETNWTEVYQHLAAVNMQQDILRTHDLKVWPQNKPFACHAYGRDCPFIEQCSEYTMPKEVPPPKRMSYSFNQEFMLCNERGRRYILAGGKEQSDESNFGTAVHSGLAELWKQAFQQQEKTYGTSTTETSN